MTIENITTAELRELINNKSENLEIVDVREEEEYNIIHIRNSKLIPMNELRARLDEIDFSKEVVFICRSGARSRMIANVVGEEGKVIKNLENGIYGCYKDCNSDILEIDKEKVADYFC